MKSFSFTAPMKKTLRELLVEGALRVALPGEFFTLSTGKKSRFFFNCKPVTLSSEGASLVADAFLDKLKLFEQPVTAVGGLTLGADPIVMAMMMRAREHGQHLDGFLVRGKQKAHGLKDRIANVPAQGTRVVIVDDVVTTGRSTTEAIDAALGVGCVIVGVIVLMDRLEENGAANIRSKVPNYHAIFTRDDFPEIGDSALWDSTSSDTPLSTHGDSSSIASGR
jgi:orotate phosphoribosyltransferase